MLPLGDSQGVNAVAPWEKSRLSCLANCACGFAIEYFLVGYCASFPNCICDHFTEGEPFSYMAVACCLNVYMVSVRRTLTLTLTHAITAYSVSGNVIRVRILVCATRQKRCIKEFTFTEYSWVIMCVCGCAIEYSYDNQLCFLFEELPLNIHTLPELIYVCCL